VRQSIEAEGRGFVEVYARCSVDELIRRDVKGLYQRALRGEIANFSGVSDPYEEPLAPEVTVDSEAAPVAGSLAKVLGYLRAAGYLEIDELPELAPAGEGSA
jgi:adenylylsulfate kinase-like enzyme